MEKAPITITATTLGRAQYNPDYYQREYMDEGDIPNHIAAILASSFRKDLKPNQKVVARNGKLHIVEKNAFDKLADWAAGRGQKDSARQSSFFKMRLFSFLSVSFSRA